MSNLHNASPLFGDDMNLEYELIMDETISKWYEPDVCFSTTRQYMYSLNASKGLMVFGNDVLHSGC